MADIVTLLGAVTANGTGAACDAGDLKNEVALGVFTTGTVSAFSVQLGGSLDNVNWVDIGSPVTTVTTSVPTGPVLARYFRAVLSGYSGTGTVTAVLGFTAGAGMSSGGSGGGGIAPPAGDIGGTAGTPTVVATHLSSALPVAQGGTGQGTAAAAITTLTGSQTSGRYLRSNGTNAVLAAIVAGDVPTLNQNTTGTAAGLSAALAVGSGGTGQASAAAAITALTGSQTSGRYLRSDGTNAALAAIVAGDVPTLNQDTTGTAAGLSASLAIGSGGTGQTTQQAAIDALTGTQSSGKVLRSDGTHATLSVIAAADLPAATTSAQGAVQLDSTPGDIKALGTQAAGTSTKAPAADHVHPPTGLSASSVNKQATSALTPSATISTFGTAATMNPDSGFAAVFPTAVTYVSSGLATETVTVQSVVTWSDATTTTASTTTAANATTNLSASQLVALMAGGGTKKASSIAWSVKSSIGSSAASVTVTLLGLNQY